jgi:hypothetical protein
VQSRYVLQKIERKNSVHKIKNEYLAFKLIFLGERVSQAQVWIEPEK